MATPLRSLWLLGMAGMGILGWIGGSRASMKGEHPESESRPRDAGVDVPTTEGSRGETLGEEGSLFYSRLASNPEPPPRALDLLLVTSRPFEEECTHECPFALRIRAGADGARLLGRIAGAIDPVLRLLAADERLPSTWRAALSRRLHAHVALVRGEDSFPAFRALSTGDPKSSDGAALITLTLYDHADPVFDAKRPAREGGGRLMIARHETLGTDGRPRLVQGLLEVGETGSRWRPPSDHMSRVIGRLRTPAMGHFHRAGTVAGLYLSESGILYHYREDGRLLAIDPGPDIVDVVRLALRRA